MWGKVVKVKFVAHLMPKILVPNLSGSKQFEPGFSPIQKWPGSDPTLLKQGCSIFGRADWADFGANRLENVLRSALPICMKVIPGFPDPLWPAKLKNGHFWVFLDFWTIKKYANGKIGDSQIEGLSTSFNLIPNYWDWTGLSRVIAR